MAAPAFRVAGTTVSGLSTLTVAPNAGHVSGDVELLFVETANEAATLSTAAGFALVTGTGVGVGTAAGTDGTRMTVFWRRWDGSAGSPVVADSGNHQIGVILSFSGAIATGNPWDVVGTNQQTATTSGSASGVTTTVADTLIVVAVAGAQPDLATTTEFSAWTNGNIASLTERVDQTMTSGNGGAIGIATGSKAATGASGATTYTTVTSTTKDNVVIALAPPAASGAALDGTISAVASVSTATLSTGIKLAGSIAAVAALPSAALTTSIKLAGAIAAVAALPSAALTTAIKLAGTVTAVVSLPSASLTTGIPLLGTVSAVSDLPSADLTTGSAAAPTLLVSWL